MNSNVNSSIIAMEQDELQTLVTEVKETVAATEDHKQIFSAAELWSIQKKMQTARPVYRRRSLNF